jgi:hypothetical protein
MDVDEERVLYLDDDEVEHRNALPEQYNRRLWLANTAAYISLHGLTSIDRFPETNDPGFVVHLLLVRCAQNIRFAVSGLSLGYYTGSSAVLRAALEALQYAVLFASKPDQIAVWLRNEFSSRPPSEFSDSRTEQMRRARKALLDWERDKRSIGEETTRFWQKANQRVHATLQGLAEQFDLDLGFLLPPGLGEAYEKAEEDFDKALEYYALLSRHSSMSHSGDGKQEDAESITIQLAGRYDESVANDLTLFCFYVSHRLLDVVDQVFTISNEKFRHDFKAWHDNMRQALQDEQ